MNKLFIRIKKVPGRRWIEYLVFWGFSFWFLARYFSAGETIEQIDWAYTLLFHLSLWFVVLVNSFILIPRLLAKGRYLIYIPLFAILIEAGIRFNQLTFNRLSDIIFPDYFFISYYERSDLFYFMITYLGITSLFQFSRSWFRESGTRQRLAEIEKEKTAQELRALRSQVQPHFLFNSLNTIYGLIRKQSPKAEEAVLKLSDLLRYTIRQNDLDEVPLEEEIKYLEQYISFQTMRLNDPSMVVFEKEGDFGSHTIIPMLLIVFVENGFKYTDFESDRPLWFNLHVNEKVIRFKSENRILAALHTIDEGKSRNGTGITNAKKRLELQYEDRYSLEINRSNGIYKVELEIKPEAG